MTLHIKGRYGTTDPRNRQRYRAGRVLRNHRDRLIADHESHRYGKSCARLVPYARRLFGVYASPARNELLAGAWDLRDSDRRHRLDRGANPDPAAVQAHPALQLAVDVRAGADRRRSLPAHLGSTVGSV